MSGKGGRGRKTYITEVAALEQLERFKSEFLGIAAHEIRTPIAAALGFLQILCNDEYTLEDAKRQHFLHMARSNMERLADLMASILEAARLTAAKESVSLEPVEVRPVIDTLVDLLRTRHGVSLPVFVPRGLRVLAAPDLLSRVLFNLAENGLKYGKGDPPCSIRVIRSAATARFVVRSTSPPLSDEEVRGLGGRFHRLPRHLDGAHGVGLGLYISMSCLGAMGSRLEIESSAQRGNRFSFSLGLPATQDAAAAPGESDGSGTRMSEESTPLPSAGSVEIR